MPKECFQQKKGKPTFCYVAAGGIPCSAPDCAVEKVMKEIAARGYDDAIIEASKI